MHFTFSTLEPKDRYKLLIGAIVPRPIAWVTTLNPVGGVNLAPFSAFNYMGNDPGIVAFSPGKTKQTLVNLEREREFVVNLVPVVLLEAMNLSATDFPSEVSELDIAGLTTAPSVQLRTPRVAQSPVNLECRVHSILEIGNNRVVIGEVLEFHIADEFVDAGKLYVDSGGLDLLARLGGAGGYATTRDRLERARIPYEAWLENQEKTLES
ncbi:MAG: flavin reductase family protein [Pleurocapsa sp. SU_196_0]|nr:flavin reductase family protein [Pleurocapsa sp. SU_196_0]